jgi:SAM-dependent methyltransferase
MSIRRAFLELLACPDCQGGIDEIAEDLLCRACGARHPVIGGVPALRRASDARTETVRAFYSDAPFPNYPPRDTLEWLRNRAAQAELPRLLDAAIPGDARVLDMGCGTGQMSLFLSSANRIVVGADLTRASLDLAVRAARRYAIERALFVETDLFAPGLRVGAFDVVYCSGVLHHTPDPRASFSSLVRLVRPGGVVLVGLYNAVARLPHRLRRALARLSGMRAVFFDPVLRDRTAEPDRRAAWLKDQYLHPEEHRHSLGEVRRWFIEEDLEWVRAHPSALVGQAPLDGRDLFDGEEDEWPLEDWIAQLGWAVKLGGEGGLFLAVGLRR